MKAGASLGVDWEQYVSVRKKHAPVLAWSDEEGGGRSRASEATGGGGMFPSLVPKPPSNPRPVSNDMPTGGRPLVDHHREVIEELRANAGEGMSSMMRALREAAAAHARNAEMAHAHAIVNPKLARRDIEKLLKDHEPQISRAEKAARKLRGEMAEAGGNAGGGNKRRRRLRVATGMDEMNLMMPKPPKGKKKGGRKHADVEPDVDVPVLQPMPRFAGAGPVANGTLLRPSRTGFLGEQGFTGVSTF